MREPLIVAAAGRRINVGDPGRKHVPEAPLCPQMRILISEDNPLNLELVRDALELDGHTVACALDGIQVVEMTRTMQPDVVLMDLHMPRLDGIAATKLLQQDPATRRIPIIAFTASAMPAQLDEALAAGCVGHITKPIDIDKLVGEIEALIHQQQKRAS
jgi:two-component system cell cycle response regulator DivK